LFNAPEGFSSGLFGVFLALKLFLLLPLMLENIALCGASYPRSTRKQQSSSSSWQSIISGSI
jgi:hypothetical protein